MVYWKPNKSKILTKLNIVPLLKETDVIILLFDEDLKVTLKIFDVLRFQALLKWFENICCKILIFAWFEG